jgi:hypothetical protein
MTDIAIAAMPDAKWSTWMDHATDEQYGAQPAKD